MRSILFVVMTFFASGCGGVGAGAGAGKPRPQSPGSQEPWERLPRPPAMPQPASSGLVDVTGARIYYAIYGNGEGDPVVLLHGGLGHGDNWGFQVPEFAKKHRVIVIDSRGHGRSTMPAGALHYADMASDVIGVLDHLQVARAAIVGSSDGAIIGIHLAIYHPNRVTRVFAFGANINAAGIRPDIGDPGLVSRLIGFAAKDYARLSPTPDGFEALSRALDGMYSREPNYSAGELARIETPVIIADGAHDEVIKQEHNDEMVRLIPGAKKLIFPDLSHLAFLQDPETLNRAILEFLDAP